MRCQRCPVPIFPISPSIIANSCSHINIIARYSNTCSVDNIRTGFHNISDAIFPVNNAVPCVVHAVVCLTIPGYINVRTGNRNRCRRSITGIGACKVIFHPILPVNSSISIIPSHVNISIVHSEACNIPVIPSAAVPSIISLPFFQ